MQRGFRRETWFAHVPQMAYEKPPFAFVCRSELNQVTDRKSKEGLHKNSLGFRSP